MGHRSFLLMVSVLAPLLFPESGRALSIQEIGLLSGPDREMVLLQGAKKEEEPLIHSTMADKTLRVVLAAFEKKYGIKVKSWNVGGAGIEQRYLAERRAGGVTIGVIENATIGETLFKIGAAIPFASPSAKNYPRAYVDPRAVATRVNFYGLVYNTGKIPEGTAPKSYDELLDSKWAGRMVLSSRSDYGSVLFVQTLIATRGEVQAEEYLRKFVKQKVVTHSSNGISLVDFVAAGEYDIALNVPAHHPIIRKKEGAPTEVSMLDPTPSQMSSIFLVEGAPSPYASMLLIDFMLSDEAQAILGKANYYPASPAVEPDASLLKTLPRVTGMKEYLTTPRDADKLRPKVEELLKKYLNR